MITRKSKVTALLDQEAYKKALDAVEKNPDSPKAQKELDAQNKNLKKFRDELRSDLKRGTNMLVNQAKDDPTKARITYYLFLDFFTTEQGGGSLLVLGDHPQLAKTFKRLKKTQHKVQISWGQLHLDEEGQLYFAPLYKGRAVKIPELFSALRSHSIKSSLPSFWSKCKRNTIHLGAPTGDTTDPGEDSADTSDYHDLSKAPRGGEDSEHDISKDRRTQSRSSESSTQETPESQPNSPTYEAYQQLRETWEQQEDSSPREAQQLINEIKKILPNLNEDYKKQGDKALKTAYELMGQEIKTFAKEVFQQAQQQLNQQKADDGMLEEIQTLLIKLQGVAGDLRPDTA